MANTRKASASALEASRERMVALLGELASGEGFLPSRLPDVRFMRSTLHVPRTPVAYRPGIFIVAQGRKWGHVGARTFVYDPHHYLVLTLPLPFECETLGAPDEPLLGLSVGLTPALVAELALQLPMGPADRRGAPRAIESAEIDLALAQAAVRLLEALRTDDDARVLGPSIVREIVYRVLRGPLGANVRALAAPHSHFGQIGRVLNRIHAEFSRALDVGALAREAGMSVSTFHAHFKAVTAASPLQYVKNTRLHKARLLMVNEGASAAQAAMAVGYESASQFSREFKRLFGATPAAEAANLRASLIQLA
jgi:AraC-like DNA-binding protein